MRVTQRLYSNLRDVSIRRWNKVWDCRGKFYDYPPVIPDVLREKGIDVVEMNQVKPEAPKWTPPVPDDPRFMEPLAPEDRPDWKEEPAYTFHKKLRLFEGVNQACILAKAQQLEGLPPAVERLVGAVDVQDRDLLLQRYIMQAQVWNTDEDKLPKRFDRRKPGWHFQREFGIRPAQSMLILLRNLLRLSQTQVTRFPSLSNRQQVADAMLHSHVIYKGKPIVLQQTLPFMVTSNDILAPFGDESVVSASAEHVIPDMWPVFPTVDFIQSNNYQLDNVAAFSKQLENIYPHTLLDICTKTFWDDTHVQGNQILTCLVTAAAIARSKYGNGVRALPEPISLQHIALKEARLVFTFFQLNTLDLDSDTGVKNLVWTGDAANLFERLAGQPWMPRPLRKTRLESFDGSVYDTFLATYLNGTSELAS